MLKLSPQPFQNFYFNLELNDVLEHYFYRRNVKNIY